MKSWHQIRMKYLVGINERTLGEDESADREFRYIDISTVGRGFLVSDPICTSFGDAPSRARRLVQAGDTIVSTVRTYLRAVWPVSGDVEDLVVSTGFAVLTPHRVDAGFLGWWAQSNPFIEAVVSRSVGVSYPAINALEIGDLYMPVPEPEEQQAIANYLDAEIARIDALIAKKQRLLAILTERRQTAIDLAIEHCWSLYGAVPMRALCERIVDCVNKTAPVASRQTGYKMIRTSNVREGRVDLSEVNHVERDVFITWNRRGEPRRGDVLLTREAPLGEVGILDVDDNVFLGQRLVMYRADRTKSLPEFILFVLLSRRAQEQISLLGAGSLHEHLRVGDCSRLLAPAAPLTVQKQVVIDLQQHLAIHSQLRSQLHQHLDLLTEHRQALITAAVTGTLEVPVRIVVPEAVAWT